MKNFAKRIAVRLIALPLLIILFLIAYYVGSAIGSTIGFGVAILLIIIGFFLIRIAQYRTAMALSITEDEWYEHFGFLTTFTRGLQRYLGMKNTMRNFDTKTCPDCNGAGCGYCGGTGKVSRIIN